MIICGRVSTLDVFAALTWGISAVAAFLSRIQRPTDTAFPAMMKPVSAKCYDYTGPSFSYPMCLRSKHECPFPLAILYVKNPSSKSRFLPSVNPNFKAPVCMCCTPLLLLHNSIYALDDLKESISPPKFICSVLLPFAKVFHFAGKCKSPNGSAAIPCGKKNLPQDQMCGSSALVLVTKAGPKVLSKTTPFSFRAFNRPSSVIESNVMRLRRMCPIELVARYCSIGFRILAFTHSARNHLLSNCRGIIGSPYHSSRSWPC